MFKYRENYTIECEKIFTDDDLKKICIEYNQYLNYYKEKSNYKNFKRYIATYIIDFPDIEKSFFTLSFYFNDSNIKDFYNYFCKFYNEYYNFIFTI